MIYDFNFSKSYNYCNFEIKSSGSGKTTLLNVLNCRNKGKLDVRGDINVNGKPVSSALALSAISGYVQQEDLYIGTLTVKEHLKFQVILLF